MNDILQSKECACILQSKAYMWQQFSSIILFVLPLLPICACNGRHTKSFKQIVFHAFTVLLLQARRNFRALRGLVRLQGVVRGQNVKRQTVNAMKQMQLLVRVQTQIQSRRIQMLENQALQHQAYRNDKEVEGTLSKWTLNQLVTSYLISVSLFLQISEKPTSVWLNCSFSWNLLYVFIVNVKICTTSYQKKRMMNGFSDLTFINLMFKL